MHAFMHYHMTKYAQWNRKIIQICSIKIQFYIMVHFYFFWNNAQLISANRLHLSSCIYLTAHSWTQKMSFYDTSRDRCVLEWRNLGQIEPILNFIAIFLNMLLLLFFLSTFWPFSPCLSLFLSHSFIHKRKPIKCSIMQVNVIYALKPEKWHNMQYKI